MQIKWDSNGENIWQSGLFLLSVSVFSIQFAKKTTILIDIVFSFLIDINFKIFKS